jgi:hypothetical protein
MDNNTGRNWFGKIFGKDAVIGEGGAYKNPEAMEDQTESEKLFEVGNIMQEGRRYKNSFRFKCRNVINNRWWSSRIIF